MNVAKNPLLENRFPRVLVVSKSTTLTLLVRDEDGRKDIVKLASGTRKGTRRLQHVREIKQHINNVSKNQSESRG